jgi:hypothetical protein
VSILDPFLLDLARQLERRGMTPGEARDAAMTACFDWSEGKGDVEPETRALASRAIERLTTVPKGGR